MSALNRKILRDLLHMRGQVIAIVLVVACGVASYVSMRNIYKSMQGTQSAYYDAYRFADLFVNARRAPEWVAERIRGIPGVGVVETRVTANVTLDVPGLAEPASGRLISIPERRAPMLNDLHLMGGRYIEPEARDEVIISAAFAEKNGFAPGDSLNAILNGRWTQLRIVGVALSPEFVYEIRPGDMFPDSRRFGVIWMGRKALAAAFDMEGGFNDVAISLARGAREEEIIRQLDQLLEPWGGLGAYGRADQVSNHFVSNEIDELKVTSTFIPAIFLLVTAFLIHLVLTRLVATQRDQIAVLKAFGYDNRAIGAHFLKLAFGAIAGGVILGCVVGWYFGFRLTALYAEFFRFPVMRYEVDPWLIGSAVAISLGAAGLGAARAVRRAVALPPAEAMRPEPPARYHTGWVERLRFLRLLPISTRIILRNLERNPVKAMLTTIAIAMSVSLLVVGFYFYDAIDIIIDLQFNRVYREDANVVFNEPRPARARFDAMGLPGVMRVEGYRFVAARLRFEHRMRRTALLGIDSAGELHRIIDTKFRVMDVPPEGLVMTGTLAESLGVREGDEVTVEVLEGERPVRRIPVVRIVDEVLGLSAYLDRRALNRLMNEGETISGVRLMVDGGRMQTLYARLKRLPAVSGVQLPEATLRNFNETLARTMGISTSIMISFACIIAFGMVYNGARIALSERGRELASLRVLGFTKGEIGVMLLGEQAILTAVAIPLGWVVGYLLCFLIVSVVDTELMRLPMIITGKTLTLALVVTVAAAILSGVLVQWRLRRLDLVEVLKTRE